MSGYRSHEPSRRTSTERSDHDRRARQAGTSAAPWPRERPEENGSPARRARAARDTRDDGAPARRDAAPAQPRGLWDYLTGSHRAAAPPAEDRRRTARRPPEDVRSTDEPRRAERRRPRDWDDEDWEGDWDDDRRQTNGRRQADDHWPAEEHADDWGDYDANSDLIRAAPRARLWGDEEEENAGDWPLTTETPTGRPRGGRGAPARPPAGSRPPRREGWRQRLLGTRRRRIITGVAAALLLFGILPSTALAVQFFRVIHLASDGLAHLDAAKTDFKTISQNPFNGTAVAAARGDLAAAHDDFAAMNGTLQQLAFASGLPLAGGKLSSALRIAPIAVEGTQAGIIACDMLALVSSRLKDPLNPTAKGLTAADLSTLTQDFGQVTALFSTVTAQVNTLQPADLTLDRRLGPAITALQSQLPKIEQGLQDGQAVLSAASTLLGVGQPTSYLLEVMDSTELRPGGGFIGNYGFLTLTGGRMGTLHIQDVDLLDAQVKYGTVVIPFPPGYNWFTAFPRWGFRDSNLDADFPTSARYAEQLYTREGGTVPVQGVIAITPWIIQNALKITGPIAVTEYKDPNNKNLPETVTADNLIAKIHYHQLTAGVAGGPDDIPDPSGSGTSLRKKFTGYLFQHFLATVKTLTATDMSQFVHLLLDSFQTKDVQVYFNNPKVEQVLNRYHAASTIQAPAQSDSLFVVDANVIASKANYFITYSMTDQVTIDATGTATHHTTLTYKWPTSPNGLANTYPANNVDHYRDYVRVYVPPHAVLKSSTGWDPTYRPPGITTFPTITAAFGRTVWGGDFVLYYGATGQLDLTWSVPGAAFHDAAGWHYDYVFQHQAGITWSLNEKISLPSCAKITSATPPLVGASAQALTINQPFVKDLYLEADYQWSDTPALKGGACV